MAILLCFFCTQPQSNRITRDRTPSYPTVPQNIKHTSCVLLREPEPIGSVFTPEKLFDADNIQDDIDMRPIGTIVIIAATTYRRLLAGPTHVPALDDVSEAISVSMMLCLS